MTSTYSWPPGAPCRQGAGRSPSCLGGSRTPAGCLPAAAGVSSARLVWLSALASPCADWRDPLGPQWEGHTVSRRRGSSSQVPGTASGAGKGPAPPPDRGHGARRQCPASSAGDRRAATLAATGCRNHDQHPAVDHARCADLASSTLSVHPLPCTLVLSTIRDRTFHLNSDSNEKFGFFVWDGAFSHFISNQTLILGRFI